MKHCLIVDDSAVIRKVARRILEALSFRISEAEDGEQALAACRAQMPDAVLLDWNMPVMDGYDFLRALRALPGGAHPKVVFCTTENGGRQHRARRCRAGADNTCMKPFEKEMHLTARWQEVGVPRLSRPPTQHQPMVLCAATRLRSQWRALSAEFACYMSRLASRTLPPSVDARYQ